MAASQRAGLMKNTIPVLVAAIAATTVFVALTARVDFPFMADDYHHLAAACGADRFTERFARWLNRVPVWSLVTWILFDSRVLERTWAPMYLFFFCHAVGLALISRWLHRQLLGVPGDTEASARPLLFVCSVTVLSLYPSTYEILYWPTCMPYTVGAVLLGLGLWANHPAVRAALLALSFLTLETFVLPALVLLAAPAVAADSQEEGRRKWAPLVGVWATGLATTFAVRWAASLSLGPYHHVTNFDPQYVTGKMAEAFKELFHVRFFAGGTSEIATAAQFGFLIVAVWLAWKRVRWKSIWLLGLCFASTAAYWVVAYPAPRAIYGSQVLFLAVLVWLVLCAAREVWARRLVAGGLAVAFAGYLYQLSFIYGIKSHNAEVLRGREAELALRIRSCVSPCSIEFRPLNEGLKTDWVLPPEYWGRYLAYMKVKYGPEKEITFEARPN